MDGTATRCSRRRKIELAAGFGLTHTPAHAFQEGGEIWSMRISTLGCNCARGCNCKQWPRSGGWRARVARLARGREKATSVYTFWNLKRRDRFCNSERCRYSWDWGFYKRANNISLIRDIREHWELQESNFMLQWKEKYIILKTVFFSLLSMLHDYRKVNRVLNLNSTQRDQTKESLI